MSGVVPVYMAEMEEDAMLGKLIDTLKISAGWDLEANKMAGALYHYMMNKHTPVDTRAYVTIFGDRLERGVHTFLWEHALEIDDLCKDFKRGPEYERLVTRGILSAKRLYDTYVLRTGGEGCVYESAVQMYVRMAAFFACQCHAYAPLRKTVADVEAVEGGEFRKMETRFDFFVYFFKILASQLVSCATPVMRSAGLKQSYLASCFILNPDLSTEEKTLSAVFRELSPLLCSKSGVGMNLTRFSAGGKNVQNCLRLINSQVEFCNDRNLRPVSVAAYMELWHEQIEEFLAAKLPENPERCQSVFQGVCVPSLFFRQYERDPDSIWYLFSPETGSRLAGLYGEEFDAEYARLVRHELYSARLPAKSLMFALINAIIKTGSPYILCKEAINRHHWFETQGEAISYANLCAEVIQQPREFTSTCNLANVCLPVCLMPRGERDPFADDGTDRLSPLSPDLYFCFDTLRAATRAALYMINAAILGGVCPAPGVRIMQAERSAGVGVQGLADVFAKLGQGYMDYKSARLDARIFEVMYYQAVRCSNQMVTVGGAPPHADWKKSKLAGGEFHWESWAVDPSSLSIGQQQWEELRESVKKHGVFNSQFIALMPTAGTSQLTGFSESFYPFYANVSSKVSNKEEIMKPNITFLERVSPSDVPLLKFYGGDVSKLPLPLAEKYKHFLTAFDYSPEEQIQRAAARSPFVDQSQSFSFFLKEANVKSASYVKNLILLGHELGLKTIMYYCRIQKQTSLTALECLPCTESPETGREACEYKGGDVEMGLAGHAQCESLSSCLSCQ
ncbi:ribonucleotide reductase subunit 1 [Equid gammaherpesvirus 5]|uniref:Ribonucleoside-diphosphate reductase large subunit n=1 Tax=Equid gammaherpesvirus 5 TaxID=10371 RepID=A0A0B4Q6S6_9GAMA|nr:ribonucleotide reductase subunit 1 [Equid gammaherpesvirus 5]AIU39586.1 ribonucleotide reductase subunit 1 [Equid gammaherpesvirus 5]APT43373.1 ribonucleotide reductase subunit 1 [Equid gammaherpesvirus 5]